jgi:phosphate acyltransferase
MNPIIAIDAMGGDHAPDEIVAGAVLARMMTRERVRLVLVGREAPVRESLRQYDAPDDIEVVNASEIVSMHDSVSSLRRKKDSSLAVAIRMQKEGKAHAMVSAGNTGAAMALSLIQLGRIPGVGRPAIAVPMPTATGKACTLIDGGANSACKAEHLYQFGVMGSLYHQHAYGVERPTVGLLSIGEEASKGNPTTQEANKLLTASSLNFVGNVEGRDIMSGEFDVIACDGFTGNVVIKFAESSITLLKNIIGDAMKSSPMSMLGGFLLRGALKKQLRKFDYQEFGGAPLLGMNGTSIICHGRSRAKAIANAVLVAEKEVRAQLNVRIRAELERNTR